MDENDKLGTIVIDGKVTNLDTIDIQELVRLDKWYDKLSKQIEKKLGEKYEGEE